MAEKILTVGPAPHIKVGTSTVQSHYIMIAALIPAMIAALMVHGFDALWILVLSVTAAVIAEGLSQYLFGQPIYAFDGHAILMGVVFALMLPPSIPWWMVFLGIVLTMVAAKQIFGGLGCYPFHPAMIGYMMLLVSWGHQLNPVGNMSLGTACPYAMALGGLILLFTFRIKWRVTVPFFVGLIASAWAFNASDPQNVAGVVDQLVTGNVILAGFFLLTDNTTSPSNKLAQVLYGLMAGVLVMVIRVYGIWMEVTPFVVLLVNMVAPILDRIQPKPLFTEKSHA